MKVLLLHPPNPDDPPLEVVVPPLGLAYLAASLEEAGHEVEILDALALAMGWEDVGREVARRRPALVGLGGMSPVIADSYAAARIVRPFAKWIVLGGPHATLRGNSVKTECDAIDFVVAGEGERSLPRLVEDLETGRDPGPGPVVGSPIEDLDALPFPARHLLPAGREHRSTPYRYLPWGKGRVATLMSSRGCPYRCLFCDKSVHGVRWRARSADNVVAEVAHILAGEARGGCEPAARTDRRASAAPPFLIFYDDLFSHDRDRVLGICEGIRRRGLSVPWKCEARPDEVDGVLLRAMREAGCEIVAFGVESGSAEALRFLRKGFTPSRIEEAFRAARQAGLKTLAYAILGIPGESPRSARASVRFVLGLDPDYAQFSTLAVFEGTPLCALARKEGWAREAAGLNPFDRDVRARYAVVPPGWENRDLKTVLRYAYLRLALRPRSIASLARALGGAGGAAPAARVVARFLGWLLGLGKKRPSAVVLRRG